MQIITNTEMIEKKKTLYQAFDGEVFTSACVCEDYERDLAIEMIKERDDIVLYENAEQMSPFDGSDNAEEYRYIWVKPLTRDAVNLLNKVYSIPQHNAVTKEHIGQIICIELGYDGDVYIAPLKNSIEYAVAVLKGLGLDASCMMSGKEPY